jgi:hypothetical protein
MLIQYNAKTANEKEFRQELITGSGIETVKQYAQNLNNKSKAELTNALFDIIDSAAVNPVWRSQFNKAFNKAMGSAVNFDVYTDAEREDMKQFTITGGVSGTSITGLFETNILPIVDGLLFDNNPVLSRVSIIDAGVNNSSLAFKLNEFASELNAENLDEDDAGTEADDRPRDGDTLTPDKKIQASTSFTEYALLTMNPTLLAQFIARLIKRTQNRLVANIFSGINSSNQFKGLINTVGSTEDDQEGSLLYNATGGADNIDKVLELAGDLPDAVTEGEESKYAYFMTRSTWYQKVRLVKDANSNYKINNVITEVGGQRTLNGLPVVFVGFGLANNRVGLYDLSNYYLAKRGQLMFKTDEGLANVKTGNVTAVARLYADGGMVMAHKNAVGSGAAANDNQARNMFRHVDLA